MAREMSSLPTPVSPVISTAASLRATRKTTLIKSCMTSLRKTAGTPRKVSHGPWPCGLGSAAIQRRFVQEKGVVYGTEVPNS